MARLPIEKIIRYESEDGLHVKAMEVGELVRCADCKHYWKNHKDGDSVPVCLASPSDEAFCSEGERKDDE